MGWGPPPHPMDLMKYCHIIIYWKWGGRQICTFVGGRGGGGDVGEQIIVIAISHEEYFQYMFLLHYFIKSMVWGRGVGGRRICLFSSSVHVWVGGGGGGWMGGTKTAF
jgi:hypothetical protein